MAPPRFHWLRLRATCHGTEDMDKVRQAMRTALGMDADPAAFDAATTEVRMESHHGGEVVLLETESTRNREVRDALDALLGQGRAAEVAGKDGRDVDARTDDDAVFYFRLDKQAAYLGERRTTRGDDALQCRVRMEVHPAKRENAVAAWQAYLATMATAAD